MEEYEVIPLMKYLHLKNKESWEQSRMISYIIAQGNSTKKIKPTDIVKFPWEEIQIEGNTSVSKEDAERLSNKAKQYIEKYAK